MTSEQIIEVANVVLQWYEGKPYQDFPLTSEEEKEILNLYYSKHGVYEEDWQEIAERIR